MEINPHPPGHPYEARHNGEHAGWFSNPAAAVASARFCAESGKVCTAHSKAVRLADGSEIPDYRLSAWMEIEEAKIKATIREETNGGSTSRTRYRSIKEALRKDTRGPARD